MKHLGINCTLFSQQNTNRKPASAFAKNQGQNSH